MARILMLVYSKENRTVILILKTSPASPICLSKISIKAQLMKN